MREARDMRNRKAIELIDKVRVRGKEIFITCMTRLKSNLVEKNGKSPILTINGIWMRAWRLAPKITPIASPVMPNLSARKIIPMIMPALYKIGDMA